MSTKRFYTGIGSRETPDRVLDQIERIASRLKKAGFWLRSGRADGADLAFEYPAGSNAELYLPWPGFQEGIDTNGYPTVIVPQGPIFLDAADYAADIHPNWGGLGFGARKLHTRNIFQVLGQDLNTPSEFLICYAEPQGKSVKGGTRTAYECAKANVIQIFNLYFERDHSLLMDFIEYQLGIAA